MSKEFRVNVREITSPRAVLKLAAEIIEHDMRQYPARKSTYKYGPGREGCCDAFEQVNNAVYEVYNAAVQRLNYTEAYYTYGSDDYKKRLRLQTIRNKRQSAVRDAQELFESLFERNGGHGYWMGKQRTNAQQERRINALLTAAELA